MSKFEKKFGKYAIPNLTLVLIMCYVAGYIIQLMGAAGGTNLLGFLTLDPYRGFFILLCSCQYFQLSDSRALLYSARSDLETGDLGDRAP